MNSYGAPGSWDHPQHPHPIVQVCPDVKPRLTKDQHDILEEQFRQQPKPSTSTKKGFADELGVPLDKINNWFQNRRAKVKQDLKKDMNARAMMEQHHPHYLSHALYLPPAQPLPSSNHDFLGLQTVVPSNQECRTQSVSCSPSASVSDQADLYSNQSGFSSRVPIIIETSQAESREEIERNMLLSGYPLSAPMDAMTSTPNGLCGYPAFNDPFSIQQYPGELGNQFVEIPYPTYLDTMDSQSPESISALDASNNMPSLTSTYSHPDWDSRKLSLPADSPLAPIDTSDEPTPTWSPSQMMGQPSGFFLNQNSSVPAMSPQNQSEFASPSQLDLPVEAFGRRGSSSSALADSMSNVDIANLEIVESGDSSQGQPSSLAERRQKTRPANLGPAALRSASYSAGMPGSPGAHQNTGADQALRRIRSSGVVGRISKPSASGQRSPLNFSFAEAAASPKFARHVSNYSMSTDSSGPLSATTNLAPPTPSTPSDFARFCNWQSQGPMKMFPSDSNSNGVSIHEESYNNGLFLNVSSPPGTPLDTDQYAQYHTQMHAQQQAMYRETPPQSAPATQLAFAATSLMPQSQTMTQSTSGDRSHVRRPSLPDNSFNVESYQQWPPVPMFNTTGDLQMSHPMQFNAHDLPQFMPQPNNSNMAGYASLADPLLGQEFSVHQYSSPQGVSCSPSPSRNDSAPKMYHFSNTGPNDFGPTANRS
ncbi:putative beta-galactosidase A [Venturia nashicola]|uniref:Putative beta-galactosidase A n=1 Tax=Venturia nashicola TaxID=86259 RepID=A0A4Z1NZG0_9PEZI|nr:putative beta-galactosidase A [Venturia nashicola]